jgi:hypothetical protein
MDMHDLSFGFGPNLVLNPRIRLASDQRDDQEQHQREAYDFVAMLY